MKCVYVIQCLDYYKIGESKHTEKRMKQHQTSNPFDLNVVLKIHSKEPKKLEKELHSRFENVRIRGEWFKLADEDIWDLFYEFEDVEMVSDLEELQYELYLSALERVKKSSKAYKTFVKNHKTKEREADIICEAYKSIMTGWKLNAKGIKSLKKYLSEYSVEEILDGLQRAYDSYVEVDGDGNPTGESVSKAWKKIPAIIKTVRRQTEKPYLKEVNYIAAICKNRFGPWYSGSYSQEIEDVHLSGVPLGDISELSKTAINFSDFIYELRQLG